MYIITDMHKNVKQGRSPSREDNTLLENMGGSEAEGGPHAHQGDHATDIGSPSLFRPFQVEQVGF